MADESIDAGLDELISDNLGTADATTPQATAEESSEPQEAVAEASGTATSQDASAVPAPTAPETFDINGRQYTREQLQAALTTREQFPHLQNKYVELLEAQRQREAAQQAAQQPQQGRQLDNGQVKAQIRASFDASVQAAVRDGFIEEDFTILYPDLAASMLMNRDALLAVANMQHQVNDKIARYEAQIEADNTRAEIDNNLVALSGRHTALNPLADPTVRQQFFGYLVQLNPQMSHLRNPDFLVSQWVAYNKNNYLGQADQVQQRQAQATQQRQASRRRAVGDALTGSRPASQAPQVQSPLDELLDDVLQGNVSRM